MTNQIKLKTYSDFSKDFRVVNEAWDLNKKTIRSLEERVEFEDAMSLKLNKAIIWCYNNLPKSFGRILNVCGVNLTWSKRYTSACTDGLYIWFHVDLLEQLTAQEVRGVIVHEMLHIVWKHSLLRGDRNPRLWNVACDYALNLWITELDGYGKTIDLPKTPDGKEAGLLDRKYEDMTAESIYNLLLEEGKNNESAEETGTGEDILEPGESPDGPTITVKRPNDEGEEEDEPSKEGEGEGEGKPKEGKDGEDQEGKDDKEGKDGKGKDGKKDKDDKGKKNNQTNTAKPGDYVISNGKFYKVNGVLENGDVDVSPITKDEADKLSKGSHEL